MLTFTILVWLMALSFFMTILASIPRDKRTPEAMNGCAFMAFVPSSAITIAIFWDVTGTIPMRGDLLLLLLLWGLLSLGLIASVFLLSVGAGLIVGLIDGFLDERPMRGNSGWVNGVLKTLVGLLGIVSSVLGILSFYIDHLS